MTDIQQMVSIQIEGHIYPVNPQIYSDILPHDQLGHSNLQKEQKIKVCLLFESNKISKDSEIVNNISDLEVTT
jgi:hypothetical protein